MTKKTVEEMRDEYDLKGRTGERGKYADAYKAGHSVRIFEDDIVVSDEYFAAIESDVREYFPDSISVNNALRKLISIFPENQGGSR